MPRMSPCNRYWAKLSIVLSQNSDAFQVGDSGKRPNEELTHLHYFEGFILVLFLFLLIYFFETRSCCVAPLTLNSMQHKLSLNSQRSFCPCLWSAEIMWLQLCTTVTDWSLYFLSTESWVFSSSLDTFPKRPGGWGLPHGQVPSGSEVTCWVSLMIAHLTSTPHFLCFSFLSSSCMRSQYITWLFSVVVCLFHGNLIKARDLSCCFSNRRTL